MRGDLRQNVLVTGASSGIGRMTARFVAAKGFHVLGTGLSSHPHEDRVEMLTLDVTPDDSIARCIDEVMTCAGQIDVLVNNAGVWQVGVAEEAQLSIVRTIFETNLFGVVRVTDAVLSGMRKRRAGGYQFRVAGGRVAGSIAVCVAGSVFQICGHVTFGSTRNLPSVSLLTSNASRGIAAKPPILPSSP